MIFARLYVWFCIYTIAPNCLCTVYHHSCYIIDPNLKVSVASQGLSSTKTDQVRTDYILTTNYDGSSMASLTLYVEMAANRILSTTNGDFLGNVNPVFYASVGANRGIDDTYSMYYNLLLLLFCVVMCAYIYIYIYNIRTVLIYIITNKPLLQILLLLIWLSLSRVPRHLSWTRWSTS